MKKSIGQFLYIQIRVLIIKTTHPSLGSQNTELDRRSDIRIEPIIEHTADETAGKGITGAGIVV